jgi:hypothetical protein
MPEQSKLGHYLFPKPQPLSGFFTQEKSTLECRQERIHLLWFRSRPRAAPLSLQSR